MEVFSSQDGYNYAVKHVGAEAIVGQESVR